MKHARLRRKTGFRFPLKGIIDHCYGVAALEFALVMPALLLLLMGGIEMGLVMYYSLVAQDGVQTAGRMFKTGAVRSSPDSLMSEIRAALRNRIPDSMVQNMYFNALAYDEFSQIGRKEVCLDSHPSGNNCVNFIDSNHNGVWDDMGRNINFNDPNGSATRGGDVVLYTIGFQWCFFTPGLSSIMGMGEDMQRKLGSGWTQSQGESWGDPGCYAIMARMVAKNEDFIN